MPLFTRRRNLGAAARRLAWCRASSPACFGGAASIPEDTKSLDRRLRRRRRAILCEGKARPSVPVLVGAEPRRHKERTRDMTSAARNASAVTQVGTAWAKGVRSATVLPMLWPIRWRPARADEDEGDGCNRRDSCGPQARNWRDGCDRLPKPPSQRGGAVAGFGLGRHWQGGAALAARRVCRAVQARTLPKDSARRPPDRGCAVTHMCRAHRRACAPVAGAVGMAACCAAE